MNDAASLGGLGLHTGAPATVTLRRSEGLLTFCGAQLAEWTAVPAERSTLLALDSGANPRRVRTVEHLFAALAGLSLHRGVAVDVTGDELPLLDGTAEKWLDALDSLGVPPSPPRAEVIAEGEVVVARSRYRFAPGDAVHVGVELDFGDDRLAPAASWDGTRERFRAIAQARTFCFIAEVEELARRGLASHVTPESVVVIGETIMTHGRPFDTDEPARHKLLDLIGDLFVYGGPPRGRVAASRPGHWSTHQAMRIALERRLIRLDPRAK